MNKPTLTALIAGLLITSPLGFPDGVQRKAPPPADRPLGVKLATIADIARYVQDSNNRVTSVESMMDQVDGVLLQNYVLMESSHARQSPSLVQYPRIILFRPDGRLMMGVATYKKSDAYDEVELHEFQADKKTWLLAALRFDPLRARQPTMHRGEHSVGGACVTCHGPSQRPVWGSYPDWRGAYADGAGIALTTYQADVLTKLADNPRLKKLQLAKSSWKTGDVFQLPNQARGYSNESFNDAVGARHSESLWQNVISNPKYDLYMMAFLLRTQGGICPTSTQQAKLAARVQREWLDRGFDGKYPHADEGDKPLLLLGLDAYQDLALGERMIDHDASDIADQRYIWQKWNYIAIYLGDLLSMQYVNQLTRDHRELEDDFKKTPYEGTVPYANLNDYRKDLSYYLWQASLQQRLDRLRKEGAPAVNLRVSTLFSTRWQQVACGHLDAIAQDISRKYP